MYLTDLFSPTTYFRHAIYVTNGALFVCSKCLNKSSYEVEGKHMQGQKQAAVNVFWNRDFRGLASMCETWLPYF